MKILLVGDPHIGFLSSSFLRGFSNKVRISLIKERLNIYNYILSSPIENVVILGDIIHKGLETDFSILEVVEILKIKEIEKKKNLILLEGHHDKGESYSEINIFPFFDEYLVLENPKRIFFNARRDMKKARENLNKLRTEEEVFLFFHEEFDIWYKKRNLPMPEDILRLEEIKECFPNSFIIDGHFHIPFEGENFWAVGSLTPISFSEALDEKSDLKWSGISFLDTEKKILERIYYFPFLFLKIEKFDDLEGLIKKISNYPSPVFCDFINPPVGILRDHKFGYLKTLVAGYRIREKSSWEEIKEEDEAPGLLTKEDIVDFVKKELGDLLSEEELKEILNNL